MAAISATRTVRVGMPNSMQANALGDANVQPVIQRPFSHVVIRWIVDHAKLALANERQVGGVIGPKCFFVFEQLHISIPFTSANATTRCCHEALNGLHQRVSAYSNASL